MTQNKINDRKKQNFDNFTNQYSLSKTLRFELKPVGEIVKYADPKTGEVMEIPMTKKMLSENNIFGVDGNIKKKYEATKPYLNRLHRRFVKEALSNVALEGYEDYIVTYKEFLKDKKDKKKIKQLEKLEKELRKQVKIFFNSQANQWKEKYSNIGFKKNDFNILFEVPQIFELLKEFYERESDAFLKDKNGEFVLDKNENKISIFDSWKNFGGYFIKFFETRKNFYKDNGTSTAISTRVINQNLRRFIDNLILFNKVKNKIDFQEVGKDNDILLNKVFIFRYYDNCLLQDGINFYNQIIGGETLKDGKKIKGLNELINEYRQNNSEKIPFFKKLDKQILSEKEGKFIDEIENDEELVEVLKEMVKTTEKKVSLFDKLIKELDKKDNSWELDKIYLNKVALNTIIYKWIGDGDAFKEELDNYLKKEKTNKEFISLVHIKNVLEKFPTEVEFWKKHFYKSENKENGFLELDENLWEQFLQIYNNELQRLHQRTITIKNKDGEDRKKEIGLDISLSKIKKVLQGFSLNDDTKEAIKDFADDTLRYYQLAKYFSLEKKREWNPLHLELGDFYIDPNFGYELFYENAYEEIVQPYNKIRNRLTKKLFSEEKWKLNFENPSLAGGWDKNKEISNSTVILRKEGKYFLGIMAKSHNDLFVDKNREKFEGEGYEKMVYKQISDASKDIQNLMVIDGKTVRKTGGKGEEKWKVFCEKNDISIDSLNYFTGDNKILEYLKNKHLPKDINKIRRQKSYLKSVDNFNLKDLHKFIDYYKERLDYFDFEFKLKDTNKYENFVQFTDDLSRQGYKISWKNISEGYINEKNKAGELYLLEIHNKNWNLDKKGGNKKTSTKNLHTLYFENLFSDENAQNNFLFKLSGEAELFFRPKTDEKKLGYREDKEGNILTFIDKDGQEKKVLKNKRYSQDKMFLHISIVLNRALANSFGFDRKVNEFLANNSEINIIGVDRGEKHLAYYSVINQKGEILESGSLNKIGDKNNRVDYYAKLTARAKEREEGRRDWKQIADIKNLKAGYISQVVRKLADLAIKHNAIIVLEDLNMRFKQIRGGIEKSIYQQLEKALIDKLNFLVNKNEIDSQKAGHLLRAYQLTAPFETFQKMGKQTGIIFYTQASYTSKIDPLTGWRPNLYLKRGNAEKNKEQISNFSKIEFIDDNFEITYDLKNFRDKKDWKNLSKKIEWTLNTKVERWRWDRKLNNNKGGYKHYKNLTDEFKELFEKYSIDIKGDILEQIKVKEASRENAGLFSKFIFLWSLLCQIRNTDGGLDDKIKKMEREEKWNEIGEKNKADVDFILSPVKPFFDSRQSEKFGKNLPQNGDDNGAFNIARKGLVILQEKLPTWQKQNEFLKTEGKKEKYYPDLYISAKEWDDFVAKK